MTDQLPDIEGSGGYKREAQPVVIVSPNGNLSSPSADPALVDETADADGLVVVDTIHNRTHRGQLFSLDLVDETLADDGTLELLIVVTGFAHLRPRAALGGDARFQTYEGATYSATGSATAAVNRNRSSSNVATTLFYSSHTLTDPGSLIQDMIIPGGGVFGAGQSAATFEEFVLPAGEYLIRLTNISGGVQVAHLQVDFYENI